MWIQLLILELIDGASAAAAQAVTPGGRVFPDRKRRRRIIRYSDFETREEYERELRIAAQPILEAPIPISALPKVDDEDEETETIFKLLMLVHDHD